MAYSKRKRYSTKSRKYSKRFSKKYYKKSMTKKFLPKRTKRKAQKLTVNVQRSLWRSDIQFAKFRFGIRGTNAASTAGILGFTIPIYSNRPLTPGGGFDSHFAAYDKAMPGATEWANLYKFGVILGASVKLQIVGNELSSGTGSNLVPSYIVSLLPIADVTAISGVASDDVAPFLNRKGVKWRTLSSAYSGKNWIKLSGYVSNPKLQGISPSEYISDSGNWAGISGSGIWTNPSKYLNAGWGLTFSEYNSVDSTTFAAGAFGISGTITYYVRLHNYGEGLIPK